MDCQLTVDVLEAGLCCPETENILKSVQSCYDYLEGIQQVSFIRCFYRDNR